ncbi:hypothetical protein MMPV_005946 [Pyropia vietnamensis]
MARRRRSGHQEATATLSSALLFSATEALTAYALTLMFTGAFYSHSRDFEAASMSVLVAGNVGAAVALLAALAIREADRGTRESELGVWAPLAGRLGLSVAVALTTGNGTAAAAVLVGAAAGHPATTGGVPFAAVVLVASLTTAVTVGLRSYVGRQAAATMTSTATTATTPATTGTGAAAPEGRGGSRREIKKRQ